MCSSESREIELGVVDLFRMWWSAKWIIIATAFVAAAFTAVITLLIPNIYRTKAVLAPAANMSMEGPRSLLSQVSSISGLNLGGADADAVQIALATLKSRSFLVSFIRNHELEVPLVAARGWDLEKEEWQIDPDIYDVQSQTWMREPTGNRPAAPTDGELFAIFAESLSVSFDRATRIVTLEFESMSPIAARDWTAMLISDLNNELRDRAMQEATSSIEYLQRQVEETDLASIREVLHSVMEDQIRTKAIAAVRESYSFTIIDPPLLPEEKVFPMRSIICIAGAFVGGVFAMIGVIVLRVIRSSEAL